MKTTRTGPGFKKLRALAREVDNTKTVVGWPENEHYPKSRGGAPVAYVATVMNYGAPEQGIPARPFIEPTLERNLARWRAMMARGADRVLDGTLTVQQLFASLGLDAQGEIQVSIQNVQGPPLALSTLMARARRKHTTLEAVPSKPLEDEGIMLRSVTYEVKQK